MTISNENFLKAISIKNEYYKVKCVMSDDVIVQIRQLSIAEQKEYFNLVNNEAEQDELVHFALSCSMLEPQCPTIETFKSMSSEGINIMNEIFMRIPKIGMSEEESKKYDEEVSQRDSELSELDEAEREDDEGLEMSENQESYLS